MGVGQKAPSPVSTFNMPASSTPGRGSAGDTRGKAVPGAYPYTLDRGRYTPVGRGQKLSPAAPTFNMSVSPTPPGLRPPPPPRGGGGSRGDTRGKAVPGRANPHTSSFFRFSPYAGPWGIYTRGGGGSRGDTRGKAVPGAYPYTLDRGGYPHGGGAKALSRCPYFQYVSSRSVRSASRNPALDLWFFRALGKQRQQHR